MMFQLASVGHKWWLPLDASKHGYQIDRLNVWVHWFMAVLFVGWGLYFLYCLIRFRGRPGHQASTELPKAKASKLSEVLVVVIEAVLLVGFSIPVWAKVHGVSGLPKPGDAMEIRVLAEQFAWNIHYPGRDGVFGPRNLELVDAQDNPIGLDRSHPDAKDDIVTLNQMHVPVNTKVLVHLSSKDVIHGFNLPLLRVKQDVVPGIEIPVWFEAVKTTNEVRQQMVETYPTSVDVLPLVKNHVAMKDCKASDGTVIAAEGDLITEEVLVKLAAAGIKEIRAAPAVPTEIACAQLCGLGHYRMRGYLHIDSQSDYEQWLSEEEQWLSEEEEEEY